MEGRVTIIGDASSVISMMQKSGDAIRGFQSQAEKSFGGLQSQIGAVQSKWVAMGSLILGGAGFKEAVDVSVNLTKESVALSKALGINATEASVLNVALGDIYQTKDSLIVANTKLTKTLKDDEEAFTKLGVKTREQNGEFRNSLDIMLDVNKRLSSFKEGTDRNIEGMKIYGKHWGEVAGLLKLNTELMEESRKKAQDLNLVVGEENIEATAKYRASMNDVEDVLTAVKKSIGDAVMPVLTELGNEFSQSGPQKVEFMRQAISVLIAGFYGLKNGVEIVWLSVKAIIQSMVVGLLTLADVATKALTFDFSGAKEAWKNGWAQIKDINAQAGEDIVAASERNGAAMRRALDRGFGPVQSTPAKGKPGATGTSAGGDKSDDKTRIRQWEMDLDLQKQAHAKMNAENGTFYEFSKAREMEYWKAILARHDLTQKERFAAERNYTKLVLEVQKDQYEARVAGLKLELESFQNNTVERERIARQAAGLAKQRYGAESKEYAQAQEEIVRTLRKRAEQQKAIENELRAAMTLRATAGVQTEQEQAQLLESMGLITKERLLAMELGFEARLYDIKRQALVDQLTLLTQNPDLDPVARQQLQRQIEELEIQHQQRISQIKNAQVVENAAPGMGVFGSAESSMQSAMDAMLTKTQSWSQALTSIYRSTGAAFITEMVSKPIAQWAAMWMRKLAMNLGFLSTENAQEAASAATGTAIAVGGATAKIAANAAVAGSGAAASQASIPYIGPILAVAAMAAIFASVMGMGSKVKSAAGGFDIPKGMNPMVQTHEEEMILPAKYANGLRDMINGGAAGVGAGEQFHYHDHSGRLSRSEIERNANVFVEVMKKRRREFS